MKVAEKKFLTPKGFTLIELLIVVTIIAALAVTVFVALNPSQRLKDARNARRTSDADTILTAIHASIVDNKGNTPSALVTPGTIYQLGTGTLAQCTLAGTGNCAVASGNCADLLKVTDTYNLTKYLKSVPVDPLGGTYTGLATGYTAVIDTNGIVTVTACGSGTDGLATPISASR
jgi:prepilin-type N-terminal cleavage/methylation domain-containing protein